jgi:CheY-like chemotaxis protein
MAELALSTNLRLSGSGCMDMLEIIPCDLVLMDVQMPEMGSRPGR